MQDPELMLLDEPVAGMSPRERDQTACLLKTISRGRSIVVIEHDMEFVRKIAHKVSVLHQGRLLSEGSMDTVQSDAKVTEVYLGL
jgi:urea transport system ATP-binding protein